MSYNSDMQEALNSRSIIDFVTEQTTPAQFSDLVKQLVTTADTKLFGPSAHALIENALLYPAVFGPEPLTFDSEAYAAVIDDMVADLGLDAVDPDRIDRLLTISREAGIVDVDEEGRLLIPATTYHLIGLLLEKYE